MTKRLFMICPTDYIESIIRGKFDGQKYFYSSLGNSFTVDGSCAGELIKVIESRQIQEITFVLSENNKIILDATQRQRYIDITGLRTNYRRIISQRKLPDQMWASQNGHVLFLSYYLKDQINKFRATLQDHSLHGVTINAMIYSKEDDCLRHIYPELALSDPDRVN